MTAGRRRATYVYCAAWSPRAPSLAHVPPGLPGLGRTRLLDAGDGLWLVVADAPLDRYGAAPLERRLRDFDWVSACALGHDAVIAHAARTATVVPMKLFTLFSADERVLDHIRRRRARLERLRARVAGRREWGVRLSLAPARHPAARTVRPRLAAGPRAGTRFLLKKQAMVAAGRRQREHAEVEARRLFRELGRHAADARRRPIVPAGARSRLVLDAAFLVPVAATGAFRVAMRAAALRARRGGYDLSLTGPWPPYTFVTERV